MTRLTWGSPQRGLVTQQVCITLLPAQLPWKLGSKRQPGRVSQPKALACIEARSCSAQAELLQGRTYPARGEEEQEQSPGHRPQAARHPEYWEGQGSGLPPPTPPEFPVSLEQLAHQLPFKSPLQGAGPALSDRLEPSPKGCNKKSPSSREHEWILAAPAVLELPPLPAAWLLSRHWDLPPPKEAAALP
ncbi:hypothetical protein Nmel_017443 [Mimus melanotis]